MNSVLREMLIANNITITFEESFHNEPSPTIDAVKVRLYTIFKFFFSLISFECTPFELIFFLNISTSEKWC